MADLENRNKAVFEALDNHPPSAFNGKVILYSPFPQKYLDQTIKLSLMRDQKAYQQRGKKGSARVDRVPVKEVEIIYYDPEQPGQLKDKLKPGDRLILHGHGDVEEESLSAFALGSEASREYYKEKKNNGTDALVTDALVYVSTKELVERLIKHEGLASEGLTGVQIKANCCITAGKLAMTERLKQLGQPSQRDDAVKELLRTFAGSFAEELRKVGAQPEYVDGYTQPRFIYGPPLPGQKDLTSMVKKLRDPKPKSEDFSGYRNKAIDEIKKPVEEAQITHKGSADSKAVPFEDKQRAKFNRVRFKIADRGVTLDEDNLSSSRAFHEM